METNDGAGNIFARAPTRRGLLASAAAVLPAAAAVAACGPVQPGGPGQTQTKQPITMRWSTWDNEKSPMVEAAGKGAALFKEKFPYLTVTPEPQISTPGGASWSEKNYAEWIAGTGPDVSGSCCAILPDWGKQGLLVNLDSLIRRDSKQIPLSDYVESQYKTWYTAERGQFALPMYMGTFALYYNRNIFRRRGVSFPDNTWDWNKWHDALVRVARPDEGVLGWFVSINFPRPGIYIRQNGGWQVDPKDSTKAVWDQTPALNALQWLHDRMWKDRTMAKSADLSALGIDAPTALREGKLAMLTEGSWSLVRMYTQGREFADQWDLAILPRGPAQRDTGATIDGWAVWTGTKHKEESWELLKFLQGDQWLELSVTIVGHQPSRKSWQERYVDLVKKVNPALADRNVAAFTDGTKQNYARAEQFFKKDGESKKVWTDTAAAVFTRNERPVADGFRDAARQVNAINASP